ncbi:CHAP domain-containing protein [Litoribrevibacter euphylliae]|uniref:CHAP domain-containing protein n=1 Tax=Litoribrevibacter euphylliae TaxID=1834034 RepID=A0ABV7HP50_9GAMM
MKKLLGLFIVIVLLVPILLYCLTYKGEREFTELNGLPEVSAVIENSRNLFGTPYDPLMGMYDNIGGRIGFIVCSDVPNIAYGKAGYSFKTLLEKSFNQRPELYDSRNGNNPSNPFFHRRARNLFSYFQSIGSLQSVSYSPQIGDLVFYRKSKNGYIAHVALVTEVFDGGYRVMESAPKTLFAQEVDMESPIERGWILAGFGKVY